MVSNNSWNAFQDLSIQKTRNYLWPFFRYDKNRYNSVGKEQGNNFKMNSLDNFMTYQLRENSVSYIKNNSYLEHPMGDNINLERSYINSCNKGMVYGMKS